MSKCKVEIAFSQFISRISRIYEKTKDVYRCNNMMFKEPKCECEKCLAKMKKANK